MNARTQQAVERLIVAKRRFFFLPFATIAEAKQARETLYLADDEFRAALNEEIRRG